MNFNINMIKPGRFASSLPRQHSTSPFNWYVDSTLRPAPRLHLTVTLSKFQIDRFDLLTTVCDLRLRMGNLLTSLFPIAEMNQLHRLLWSPVADRNDTHRQLEQHYQRPRNAEQLAETSLERANLYLYKGIQPEVWPTEEEFQSAKTRIRYDPEKLHLAICGNSGSGKSSLINAFRSLKNIDPGAASTGVNETTISVTRYPDPHDQLPRSRIIWFDVPGAGTLKVPGWQYFNEQGLFIFDIIILVYDVVSIPQSVIIRQTIHPRHPI